MMYTHCRFQSSYFFRSFGHLDFEMVTIRVCLLRTHGSRKVAYWFSLWADNGALNKRHKYRFGAGGLS